MRGDRLGLGHMGEVQDGVKRAGIEVNSGDGRGAIQERDADVVDRCAGLDRDAGRETTSHWIVIYDSARAKLGQDGIHRTSSGEGHTGCQATDWTSGTTGTCEARQVV